MYLSSTMSGNLSLVDAAVIAILGYAVVFFGLILLMLVVIALGKYFIAKENTSATAPATEEIASSSATAVSFNSAVADPSKDTAPGTAGQLKLYDTPPKTAAMIMAIVANQMGKPLNELRFISIKEVK